MLDLENSIFRRIFVLFIYVFVKSRLLNFSKTVETHNGKKTDKYFNFFSLLKYFQINVFFNRASVYKY